MPGRKYTAGGGYRYGFNGKENDNEVKGEGNQQDYGMRIYDTRLGKFLSVDPITGSYPELTPYQFASNNPVMNIDLDGLEGLAGNMASPGKWHIPGDANDDGHLTKQELKEGGTIMTVTALLPVEVFVTKGWITTILTATQVFGAFNHNRAKTPEGRQLQDQQSKAAIADAFITWGIGKVLGAGIYTSNAVIKLATNRFNFAKKFYMSAGYSEAAAIDGVRGIELTEKVFETTLKKGTIVEQWLKVDKTTGKLIPGNYYTLPGADPSKLGISLEGRVKVQSVLNEDTKFLQSTTTDILDTWTTPGKAVSTQGGEIQLFQPKVNATPIKQ